MLCLTTRLVPWAEESLERRLRTLLDTQIPGIILSQQDPLDHWAILGREITGAKFHLPAAILPTAAKPFLPGRPALLPHLDALDESESQHALESVLSGLEKAQDLEIPALILSAPEQRPGPVFDQLLVKHRGWFQQRRRLLESVPKGDVEVAANVENRLLTLRGEYQRFFGEWKKSQPPVNRRLDSLLRNLDKILDAADRIGTQILLMESRHPLTPLGRDSLPETLQRFAGAPLSFLLDPTAESANRDLQGLDTIAALQPPDQEAAGILLGNYNASFEETLPLSGVLNPDLLFCKGSTPLSLPLHILDPAPGSSLDELQQTVIECRSRGFDGDPPPVAGEPWKIF
ncbi:MAG: hypothetical protein CBC13_06935 [Planctomycetia bacterium TMED53]|nr:MAG: hypothetical protein CBC13_06935 [Planctomycetia bacterium TMED53]